MLERLKNASEITVGTKQTMKALQSGEAQVVYLAEDADGHVTKPLVDACRKTGVEVTRVSTMLELGKACGIEVGSASAAVIKD
ncbi:large subunit ribosomal protein L7A [Desulfitispora alkaliphila]|uniref:L7Ae/L30e/S12e/Gadd45 family ribosomal protein n=1 Tax=Desulfitispora alkaliphila TaxID=622674 RepID=UPI003D1FA4A9